MKPSCEFGWMARLAVAGLLAWPATMASAQLQVETDAEALDTGRSQTVVITQRPLRTFRGEAVRVGRYAESEKAIGVVRPLRPVPSFSYRDGYRYGYDRYTPRYEKAIGVVRPYVTYAPPVYNPPQTITTPNAQDESSASRAPTIDLQPVLAQDIEVTAVETVVVPEAHRDDAWALLSHGYCRDARQQFALLGTVDDTPTRTGHALAAVLSGDLAGGVALMPDTPELPEGVVFRPATIKRLDQMREYLYADQPEMQAKLLAILDAVRPAVVTAE